MVAGPISMESPISLSSLHISKDAFGTLVTSSLSVVKLNTTTTKTQFIISLVSAKTEDLKETEDLRETEDFRETEL